VLVSLLTTEKRKHALDRTLEKVTAYYENWLFLAAERQDILHYTAVFLYLKKIGLGASRGE
jgi:hypothetical protein